MKLEMWVMMMMIIIIVVDDYDDDDDDFTLTIFELHFGEAHGVTVVIPALLPTCNQYKQISYPFQPLCLKIFLSMPATARYTACVYCRSFAGIWVRIPPGAWMFALVSVVCCQVEVSASD
jgi:hypothetical protein